MAENSQKFSDILWPGFSNIYGMSYPDWPEEYTKLHTMKQADKYQMKDHTVTGFGLVPQKPKGQGVSYDTAYDGYDKTYTITTYGLGFIVELELYEDELYGVMNMLPKALKRSVLHTIETLGAAPFNEAFSATNYTGADGKELCASDHPLLAGGTGRNEPTNPADLDTASLEQALIDIRDFRDDRGLRSRVSPVSLHVHATNDWQGQKLLESAQEPDTANNAKNPGMGVFPQGMHIHNFFTDLDAWFIKTNCEGGTTGYFKRPPRFTKDNDFDSDNAKYKATFRVGFGHTDWRKWYGSEGQ